MVSYYSDIIDGKGVSREKRSAVFISCDCAHKNFEQHVVLRETYCRIFTGVLTRKPALFL